MILAGSCASVVAQNKTRIIHFPRDRSLGMLKTREVNTVLQIKTFHYWIRKSDWWRPEWEYFGEAIGSVNVPVGKQLGLFVTKPPEWKDLSPLAKLQPDDLYMVNICGSYQNGPRPGNRCMKNIRGLTGLKVLELNYTNITSRGLKFLDEMKSLEQLSLHGPIANKGLATIAQLPSLKRLYLKQANITNAGLKHLAALTSLEELALSGKYLGDSGLVHLSKLPSLYYLMLAGKKNFSDAGMVFLKDIPNLRILHIGSLTQITDAGLANLANLPKLERLNCHWTEGITDKGLAHLRKMRSLKMLDIGHANITDAGLAHLSEIKSLEHLSLPSERVTDKGLGYLGQLRLILIGLKLLD